MSKKIIAKKLIESKDEKIYLYQDENGSWFPIHKDRVKDIQIADIDYNKTMRSLTIPKDNPDQFSLIGTLNFVFILTSIFAAFGLLIYGAIHTNLLCVVNGWLIVTLYILIMRVAHE